MRTRNIILTSAALAGGGCAALGGPVGFSNFTNFIGNPGASAQASAVTLGNDAIVVPFQSNTASMRVVLDAVADVSRVRVLTPTLFVDSSGNTLPHGGVVAGEADDLNPRGAQNPAGDPSSLAPLRVSIYASAADVESRSAFASLDFGAGEYDFSLWSGNNAFYEVGFDLGPTLTLGVGEWFIEVAQVDPASAQFFLALNAGEGMHRFNTDTMALQNTNFEFALELGSGVVIPLPTGGALTLMGLSAVIARRRRGC